MTGDDAAVRYVKNRNMGSHFNLSHHGPGSRTSLLTLSVLANLRKVVNGTHISTAGLHLERRMLLRLSTTVCSASQFDFGVCDVDFEDKNQDNPLTYLNANSQGPCFRPSVPHYGFHFMSLRFPKYKRRPRRRQ
jgi:hypothetical protein